MIHSNWAINESDRNLRFARFPLHQLSEFHYINRHHTLAVNTTVRRFGFVFRDALLPKIRSERVQAPNINRPNVCGCQSDFGENVYTISSSHVFAAGDEMTNFRQRLCNQS